MNLIPGAVPAGFVIGQVVALVTITLGQMAGMIALVAGVSELIAAIVHADRLAEGDNTVTDTRPG